MTAKLTNTAEFVGLARLALADALDLGRMQRVELVLVKALLRADALGALQQGLQRAQCRRTGWLHRRRTAGSDSLGLCTLLALHFAHHHSKNRALALDDLLQALELLGMALQAALGQRPNPS